MFKRKYFLPTIATLLIIASVLGCSAAKPHTMPTDLKGVHTYPATGTIDVAFSPNGGITGMIIGEIANAKQSIRVQAYSFTSSEIINALIAAKQRGVDVRIIIDKSNVTGQQKEKALLDSIAAAGISMKVDSDFQIAHSKIIIIDGIDVITGSFNFTNSAEHNNAENCLVLHGNKPLAGEYVKNWQWRWNETELYK